MLIMARVAETMKLSARLEAVALEFCRLPAADIGQITLCCRSVLSVGVYVHG